MYERGALWTLMATGACHERTTLLISDKNFSYCADTQQDGQGTARSGQAREAGDAGGENSMTGTRDGWLAEQHNSHSCPTLNRTLSLTPEHTNHKHTKRTHIAHATPCHAHSCPTCNPTPEHTSKRTPCARPTPLGVSYNKRGMVCRLLGQRMVVDWQQHSHSRRS